jgi:hypothetical protein
MLKLRALNLKYLMPFDKGIKACHFVLNIAVHVKKRL